jgi:hypothetical protein
MTTVDHGTTSPLDLRAGGPLWAIAFAIMTGTLALVVLAAARDTSGVRGYASLSATPGRCILDPRQRLNAVGCARVGRNVYRVAFSRSLAGSAPVVSREACCPGPAAVSVESERAVVVVFPGATRYPIRASVVIP